MLSREAVIEQFRQSIHCLVLELHPDVHKDVKAKADAILSLLPSDEALGRAAEMAIKKYNEKTPWGPIGYVELGRAILEALEAQKHGG